MLHSDALPQYTKMPVITRYIKNSMYALIRSGLLNGFIRTTRVQCPNLIRLAINRTIAMIKSAENIIMLLFIIRSIISCYTFSQVQAHDSSVNAWYHLDLF